MQCVICQHNTDRYACTKCQRRISDHLGDIVNYAALAEDELLPGRGGDGRSTERSLGIRLQALDLVSGHTVLPILESWERMFREEWGYAPWGPTSLERGKGQQDQPTAYLTGTVAFLRGNLDRICQHAAVDDFSSEITQVWRQAREAARQQPRQAWRVTCPADADDGECGNVLRITGEDFGREVTCKACRTTWPTDRLLMVVATSTQARLWVDAAAINTMAGLTDRTLRRWAKEGRISRQGGLYDFAQVMDTMRQGATA
jgi:hypothetical protein